MASDAPPRSPATPKLVLYLNEGGPRVATALARLRTALQRADWSTRHAVDLRHVELDPSLFSGAALRHSTTGVEATMPPALVARIREALAARPDALIASSALIALAAQRASDRVPILFASHQDPVTLGIVASMQQPGRNATGFTFYAPVEAKRLELLRTIQPGLRRLGVVGNQWWDDDPGSWTFAAIARERFGMEVVTIRADDVAQLRQALATPAARAVDGWYVPNEPAFRDPAGVAAAINETGKPAIYSMGLVAAQGGLMSYQAIAEDPFATWAKLLGMVLDGAPVARIPVESPKVFELHLNSITARALGIELPRSLLLRATVVH